MNIKSNCFVHISEKSKKAIMLDTFNGKKYFLLYDFATRLLKDELTEYEVKGINDILCDDLGSKNPDNKALDELRIVLTNMCNFSCTYCYADHGCYGMPISQISIDTLRKVMRYFCERYSSIRQIVFFGGEPLLCIEAIEYVCECMKQIYGPKIPKFCLITNGALLNDKAVSVIKKYNIATVVSIDGPKHINDKQRIMNNNSSAFDIVDNNLNKYKNDLNISIEATYTANHVNSKISREQLREYLKERYDADRIIISDVSVNEENLEQINMQVEKEKIDYDILEYVDGAGTCDDYIFEYIRTFLKGYHSTQFCSAGIKKFTVDMNGNIYPCHLFVGKTKYILGNVDNTENLVCDKFPNKNEGECKKCKYKAFCNACTFEIIKGTDICSKNKRNIDYFLHGMLEKYLNSKEEYDNKIEECIKYGRKNDI